MVALIIAQLYWINNAFKLKKEHFEQAVNEVLRNVVSKNEKKSAATKITKKFNFKKQGIRYMDKQDSLKSHSRIADANTLNIQPNQFHVKISEELQSDSAGVIVKKSKQKYYSSDSAGISDINFYDNLIKDGPMGLSLDSSTGQNRWFSHQKDVVNDIFDEFISVNVYNDYDDKINTALIDSILKNELHEKAIFANYHFGISDQTGKILFHNDTTSDGKELFNSNFKVNLAPDNVFIEPKFLSIVFPNQENYILKTMWLMLTSSVALVVALMFSFYFSISTLFKQKKLSDVKNDFIGNMTHEFKTPISTISLACEVLGDSSIEKTKEKVEKYVKVIQEENKRLGLLVENVLQTAILDKGEFKLKIEKVDIHEIIDRAINNISLQVHKREGKITTSLNATNSSLSADKVHLTNVIYNLADNALKYTEGAPLIEITTENKNNQLIVAVKDNGIGISKENQKKIFDTLYRVPTGNIHNVKGFGLGLSYVKAVVEKHGGTVAVESELGNGSIFRISLPLIT